MKKLGKSSKKGFTLVELIVVLVILAVLAAMLVPALTGYINKAKQEKEYQAASTVYTAVQAMATEAFAKDADGTIEATDILRSDVQTLTSLDLSKADIKVAFDTTNKAQISKISIKFNTEDTNAKYYNYEVNAATWTYDSALDGTTAIKTSTTGGGAATT